MGRIPEDRHEGVVGDLTVYENLALEHLDKFSHNGFLDRKAIRNHADQLIQQFQIKAKPSDRIRTLSGGNMQKVLLARVLSTQPKIVIAPQPTRGLDVQRLCIARAVALEPEVLLMDEPTSAIDPLAMAKVEELIDELKGTYTIAIVTHNMQQAARISDYTAFFYRGRIIEVGETQQIFTNPRNKQTEDYITGRFG